MMNGKRMRQWMIVSAAMVGWISVSARAEEFTFLHHVAAGSGWAHIFDGEPIHNTDSGATSGPNDWHMAFGAYDCMGVGSDLKCFDVAGLSWVPSSGDTLNVVSRFRVKYFEDSMGGSHPGGEGEGVLSSIVDFIRPAGPIDWSYDFNIRHSVNFDGQTSVVVENVTQSQTLLTLSDSNDPPFVETTLGGNAGDLIRITSQMSAEGNVPGGVFSSGSYSVDSYMHFTRVPEVGTLALLAFGSLPALRRRRRV